MEAHTPASTRGDPDRLVLVVDSDRSRRETAGRHLEAAGFRVLEAADGMAGWTHFRKAEPHAVVVGFALAGMGGIELLRRIREVASVPVILQAGEPRIAETVDAIRSGADDVVALPRDLQRLLECLRAAISQSDAAPARNLERLMIGRSEPMRVVRERVLALANLSVPVLIRGEEGTGRLHVARLLHELGRRRDRQLVTRTADQPPGRRDPDPRCDYYLEEIGGFPLQEQARWAQILRRQGDSSSEGQRIFASISTDLAGLARQGGFDAELAQRLDRFTIDLPPLRDRLEDVPPLARALAEKVGTKLGRPRVQLTAPAAKLLRSHTWPGNVAELEGVIERLVAFAADGRIAKAQVNAVLGETPMGVDSSRRTRIRRQREELVELIAETEGNLAEVARRLDMSRGAIIYRAQKFGLLPKP